MKKKQDDFELLQNLPEAARDPEIKDEDFTLVTTDTKIHDQKFQTKPTTFLKDCLRRFKKNKSSVVAALILGFLLLLSLVIPVVSPYDVSVDASNTGFEYLEPKLFNSGTGFWDGTRNFKDYDVDISANPDAKTEREKQEDWWPSSDFKRSGITNKKFSDRLYTDSVSPFGRGGFLRHSILSSIKSEKEYAELRTQDIDTYLDFNTTTIKVTSYDSYDIDKINLLPDEQAQSIDDGYELVEAGLYFVAVDVDTTTKKSVKTYYEIVAPSVVHSIGSAVAELSESPVDVGQKVALQTNRKVFENYYFCVAIKNERDGKNKSHLIRSLTYDVIGNEGLKEKLCDYDFVQSNKTVRNNGASFDDASVAGNDTYFLDEEHTQINYAFLISENAGRLLFMSKVYRVSFSYDSYEAKLGDKFQKVSHTLIRNWSNKNLNKWKTPLMYLDVQVGYDPVQDKNVVVYFEYEKLDDRCPIAKDLTIENIRVFQKDDPISDYEYDVYGYVTQYKLYGYETMPKFLFGTDKNGKDMLKYVFDGLRWSLLLGIVSSAVCFIFGLVWGAICGYFGGNVDLIMERFTDVLSGIPWIVVMTLVIIRMGSTFVSFALALCLTGWIGTAATTRTQFYRFRGREYVLASRTLGASDARLIAKHILPNAMGTIITSAVLMVPSVIFSEATISYLGLGFQNLSSLGVILSHNQAELKQYPHLLIFPAVIIALLMISFNLFGNGLRDAVNPSLKGEDE